MVEENREIRVQVDRMAVQVDTLRFQVDRLRVQVDRMPRQVAQNDFRTNKKDRISSKRLIRS